MNIDFEELHVFDKSLGKHVPIEMLEKAQAESDRLRGLLRRENKTRVEKGMCCFVCGAGVHGFTRTGRFELTDNHTEDCELAEELKENNNGGG